MTGPFNTRPLATAVLLGAMAMPGVHVPNAEAVSTDSRPRISLFPTSVVENLKATSQSAAQLENEMFDVVDRMESLHTAYQETQCEREDDSGCKTLRKEIRKSYSEMLDVMRDRLPAMRETLHSTSSLMAERLRQEIGQKMTPGDVQRELAGRSFGLGAFRTPPPKASQGKLSRMFARYYELVARGGSQADSLPVLASQIHLDARTSLDYLDKIELEISSQSTELVLELEWGELDETMLETAYNVKALLWGDPQANEKILDVGLENPTPRDTYADLLVD